MENILKNNKSPNKDDEFKIYLSIKDIDNIHDEINSMNDNAKKNLDGPSTIKVENDLIVEKQKDHNIINGITLLNTCVTCNNKFRPINSMIDEPSCVLCSNKK
ncbi:MAG TPA: hypothetical protein VIS47_04720 [Nitrosopumilus sp.]